ncbi:Hypothetical protein A7982_04961 [Minicystis rosea]|nr:Hypothetical protein A7982_04961 [Minicystis rosea]
MRDGMAIVPRFSQPTARDGSGLGFGSTMRIVLGSGYDSPRLRTRIHAGCARLETP